VVYAFCLIKVCPPFEATPFSFWGFLVMLDKYILDVCCGCRQFWFDKNHKNTVYMDMRKEEKGFQNARPNKEIQPDIIGDFRNIPFSNRSFKMVVMDPPHILADGPLFRMAKEYGWLDKLNWWNDIRDGFNEAWRVLDNYGTLIFKWNETSISKKDVLNAIGKRPLFGHPVGSRVNTHWLCFMKTT